MRKNLVYMIGILIIIEISLSATACQTILPAPEINQKLRSEAESTAKEAAETYKQSKELIDDQFSSFPAPDALSEIKKHRYLFQAEADNFKTAEDKFRQASSQYAEALGGGKESDSEIQRRMLHLSGAYKKWAELAELDRQICQAAAEIKDLKSFTDRANELNEEAKQLNDEVIREIMSA